MKIYIMRHGPAEEDAATGRDFDRKLTPSGRLRTEVAAHELGRWERPRVVVSSPLIRAVETAEVVIAALGLAREPEIRNELAPAGNAMALIRELAEAKTKRLLLIGHEPDVSRLTALLLPTWSRSFDKAMIVGLKIDRAVLTGQPTPHPIAKLRFVIEPKRLHN